MNKVWQTHQWNPFKVRIKSFRNGFTKSSRFAWRFPKREIGRVFTKEGSKDMGSPVKSPSPWYLPILFLLVVGQRVSPLKSIAGLGWVHFGEHSSFCICLKVMYIIMPDILLIKDVKMKVFNAWQQLINEFSGKLTLTYCSIDNSKKTHTRI